MAVRRIDFFDEQGFLRSTDPDWSLYMAFAPISEADTVVKIGVSSRLYERLVGLRCACPFAMQITRWSRTGTRAKAYKIERALHTMFAARRTSGEWFRFDMSCPLQKREFHDGVAAVFAEHEVSPAWKTITHEQLLAYSSLKASNMHSKEKAARRYT